MTEKKVSSAEPTTNIPTTNFDRTFFSQLESCMRWWMGSIGREEISSKISCVLGGIHFLTMDRRWGCHQPTKSDGDAVYEFILRNRNILEIEAPVLWVRIDSILREREQYYQKQTQRERELLSNRSIDNGDVIHADPEDDDDNKIEERDIPFIPLIPVPGVDKFPIIFPSKKHGDDVVEEVPIPHSTHHHHHHSRVRPREEWYPQRWRKELHIPFPPICIVRMHPSLQQKAGWHRHMKKLRRY